MAIPAGLALLLLAISIAGSELGRRIVADQRTESRAAREIVIGNDVFQVPENTIRFAEARRDGVHERLELYLRWPELEGYTEEARDEFNHAEGRKTIIFLTLEPPLVAPDMSGRLEPIYRQLIHPDAEDGPGGLLLHPFSEHSGFGEEVLAVGERSGGSPFVARCLAGDLAARSLAPCTRDVRLTDDVALTYRFPEQLLGDWRALDKAVTAKARAFLQTSKGLEPRPQDQSRSTSRMAIEKL